jgi:hypothetical protein|tara:strand:- start:2630 stop:2776 length:147 start_codon:yes stop_codon:yes gene_type:complete
MPGYSQGQAMIASQAGDPKKIEKADFAKLRKKKKKKQPLYDKVKMNGS